MDICIFPDWCYLAKVRIILHIKIHSMIPFRKIKCIHMYIHIYIFYSQFTECFHLNENNRQIFLFFSYLFIPSSEFNPEKSLLIFQLRRVVMKGINDLHNCWKSWETNIEGSAASIQKINKCLNYRKAAIH